MQRRKNVQPDKLGVGSGGFSGHILADLAAFQLPVGSHRPLPRDIGKAAVNAHIAKRPDWRGGVARQGQTEPGQTVVKHGVTIASPLNLPATMPEHASELYSKNITSLLELLIKDGALAPDFSDEVVAASCVTREVQN